MSDTPLTVDFGRGLLGLRDLHRFALTAPTADCPLGWLRSLEEPAVGFAVADPFRFRPDYELLLDEEQQAELGVDGRPPLVLVIVRIPADDPAAMTANLLGPLVINLAAGLGCQVVLSDSRYGLREPLLARVPEVAPC